MYLKGVVNLELLIMPINLVSLEISAQSKLLYTIILYLCQSDTGSYYCCPSNEWLAKQLDCCENSITKYLKELRDNNLVRVQENRFLTSGTFITRRVISLTPTSSQHIAELQKAYKLFHIEAFDEERESWNNLPDVDLGDDEPEEEPLNAKVLNYLNTKAGTKYRTSSKTHLKWIDARIKEGYKYEDFVKVIDNKCAEWLYTNMEQYLRPSTLFSNKFDTYLNQRINVSTQQIEKRKQTQIQNNTINPYQYNIPVNEQLYNNEQALSDDWFGKQMF